MSTPTRTRTLSAKRRAFVAEYLVDFNGTQAAIRAGYNPANAKSQAHDLLTKPDVQVALQAQLQARGTRTEQEQARLQRQLERIGYSNMGDAFDEHGHHRQPHEWPAEFAPAVGRVTLRKQRDVDGAVYEVVDLAVKDSAPALALLARHNGFVDARPGVTVNINVVPLEDARRRFAELWEKLVTGPARLRALTGPTTRVVCCRCKIVMVDGPDGEPSLSTCEACSQGQVS